MYVTVKDCVTFWIAVIGFLLSIYNFVSGLIKESRQIDVSVKFTYHISGFLVMVLQITNKSRLGISITSGTIITKEEAEIPFGETSKAVFTYDSPELRGKVSERTVLFPVHIEPLRSTRVFIQTDSWNPSLPLDCKIRLGSSRGMIKKKISIPDVTDDFLLLLGHLE